ncbi:hypothetical protein SETIT_9G383600v2 [Setaria italica]|uniref:Uncharacterized protein n=1 Tax=Setaria italica TaxID=4555 RepID=A0A368SQ48_SETIT|nr:hypothetical protein SETIT_9G383600v2 [Setaria italica]
MDPCVTPDNGGSGTDGNGGCFAHTLSQRRRLQSSSPTGSQLMSEFDATANGRGSESSSPLSSSTSCDLELDESHNSHNIHRVNPEDSPTPSPVQHLLLVSSVHTQVSTDDDVLVMDGVLVDDGLRTPSSAMRSISSIDNNRHGIRRSVSTSDLIVISSGAQGSSSGRSGGGSSRGSNSRRSGFGGQFYQRREDHRGTQFQRTSRYYELGSSSRRHAQGAGPSNFQQGQQLPPFPSNIQQGQQYTYNNMQLPQYPHHMTPPAYMAPWVAPASPPSYTFAPAMVTIPPAVYYPPYGIRRPGVYPPPGITIRHPDGSPAPPPRRSETPIVIRAPPADEAGTSAPKQTETPPPLPPPEQPETPPPAPEQPEPTSGQESFVLEVLYGPSTSARPRLPVFRDICPDDEAGQAPPPPPPCARHGSPLRPVHPRPS